MHMIITPDVLLTQNAKDKIDILSNNDYRNIIQYRHVTVTYMNENASLMEAKTIVLHGNYAEFKTGCKHNSNKLVGLASNCGTMIYFVLSKSGIGVYLNYLTRDQGKTLSTLVKDIHDIVYIDDSKKLKDECRIACVLTILEDR